MIPRARAALRGVAPEETETWLKTGSLDTAWLARVDKEKVKSQIERAHDPPSTWHLPASQCPDGPVPS